MEIRNITGYYYTNFNYKEAIQDGDGIMVKGLLLPKNKVSRNKILYDWDSIKQHYKELEACKLMYNHETEGLVEPIGHITKSYLKENDDSEGIAGWYYQANLDPDNKYTKKIQRGDLDNVSIQLNAERAIKEHDKENGEYTRAFVSDVYEISAVPCPGFNQTTIETMMAEAFKKQNSNLSVREDVNLATASGTTITKMRNNKEESTMVDEEKPKIEEPSYLKQEEYIDDMNDVADNIGIIRKRTEGYEDDFGKITALIQALSDRIKVLEDKEVSEGEMAEAKKKEAVEPEKTETPEEVKKESEIPKEEEIKKESENPEDEIKKDEDEKVLKEPEPPMVEKTKFKDTYKETVSKEDGKRVLAEALKKWIK